MRAKTVRVNGSRKYVYKHPFFAKSTNNLPHTYCSVLHILSEISDIHGNKNGFIGIPGVMKMCLSHDWRQYHNR